MTNPFDAIEAAIQSAHPDAELLFFGGVPAHTNHVLNGAVVVRVSAPAPHWLVVSQGFTELREKSSSDPTTSGLGFELVCRVPARDGHQDFGWVIRWMQGVADILAHNGSHLDAGDTIDMTTPEDDREVCAVAFVPDVELAPTVSENGHFAFLQMVGLRRRELNATHTWNTDSFVALLREYDALSILDTRVLDRLDDPAFQSRVDAGIARDGSSLGVLTGVAITWTVADGDIHLHLGPNAVEEMVHAVARRLAHGRSMVFHGTSDNPDRVVVLRPEAGVSRIEVRNGTEGAMVLVDSAAQAEIVALLSAPEPVPAQGVRLQGANVRISLA